MLVFGTRPEAIKMAPLVKAFQKEFDKFQTIVCVTGQHREMLDQVLGIFDIKPDYDLNIMKQGQDLYDVTSRVLLGMRDVLKKVRPDIVLVHGDTTTSTAAALAAFYQQIPVGHVEAGLRTHNIYSPWPEEMNRQITGRIATYHFSPTPLSRQNLLAEGLREEAVMVTGNTVIDALYMVVDKIKSDKILDAKLEDTLNQAGYNVNRLANGKKLVLITGHRRENFGDGFISMCTAIKDLAQKYPDVDFVYPMHLNPNVRKPIHEVFGENLSGLSNMFFIEPLEYLSFIYLMEKSAQIIDDTVGNTLVSASTLDKDIKAELEKTNNVDAAAKLGTVIAKKALDIVIFCIVGAVAFGLQFGLLCQLPRFRGGCLRRAGYTGAEPQVTAQMHSGAQLLLGLAQLLRRVEAAPEAAFNVGAVLRGALLQGNVCPALVHRQPAACGIYRTGMFHRHPVGFDHLGGHGFGGKLCPKALQPQMQRGLLAYLAVKQGELCKQRQQFVFEQRRFRYGLRLQRSGKAAFVRGHDRGGASQHLAPARSLHGVHQLVFRHPLLPRKLVLNGKKVVCVGKA